MGLLKYLHRRKNAQAKLKQSHASVQHSSHHNSSHQSSLHQGSSHQSSLHQGSSHQSSLRQGSSHQGSSHQGTSRTTLASLFSRRSFSSSDTSATSTHGSSVAEFLHVDPEHERLLEAFRIIDKDGDGKISKQELGMMWQRLGEQISEEELLYMIQDADGDGDGLVDFHEFIDLQRIMGAEDNEERSREIRLAFNVADVDKRGRISASELQKVMQILGQQKVTLDECIAMCQLVDADGDGMISFEEFERLMKSNAFEDLD